ncbi:MAG TPA: GSU2403 family nucleotidyltransferase fold protein [Longimicrobium sp.]
MNDLPEFARLIEALRPWLGQLVVAGGWAHRLHRFSSLTDPPLHEPVVTLDADLVFALNDAPQGNMASALKAAGFHKMFFGEHTPPVSRYALGREKHGFYAEFLAPLAGSGFTRTGRPDATVAKAGITAQKLRYVDLLLVHPLRVTIGSEVGFPLSAPAEVRVSNPVSFIAQKLLIHTERTADKRAQDVVYIHDTLELFARHLATLAEVWREQVRPSLQPRTAATVERLARERFRVVDDVIRRAARIPPRRTLVPETVRAVCAYGLETIWGAA